MSDIEITTENADKQMRRLAAATIAFIEAADLAEDAATNGTLAGIDAYTLKRLQGMVDKADEITEAVSRVLDVAASITAAASADA